MRIYLESGAFEPTRGHKEDAGIDLRTPKRVVINPDDGVAIDTKVHIEIPAGFFGKLESKSGLNVKHGVVSLGGIIDSGYTGSIVAKIYNFGYKPYVFEAGDKIVQLVVQSCLCDNLELVDSLELFDEAERGNDGFGSTGK